MIFDPFDVLAYCSGCMPMEAGDVISLGTEEKWPNFTASGPLVKEALAKGVSEIGTRSGVCSR